MNKAKLMGVLNITPDSFFAQSRVADPNEAIQRGLEMTKQGADILDVGGESTRPGAQPLSEEEELNRVIPVIQGLKEKVRIPISIDTVKPDVARKALEAGATMINDVSGFRSPLMRELAATTSAELCVMHMQGTPQVMQLNPSYPEGVVNHLLNWFENRIEELISLGVSEQRIILDPGIGFGKTVEDNLVIIHHLESFKQLGFPILLGASRKSFMTKILNKPPSDLLPTTLAVNTIAIMAGVDIIRVHDVPEHRDLIDFLTIIQGSNT